MLTNLGHQIFKLIRPTERLLGTLKRPNEHPVFNEPSLRHYHDDNKSKSSDGEPPPNTDANELVTVSPREILEKEFPEYFSNGKFIKRISYVDFIDQALEKLKELGLERDLESYKTLLRIFPPGKYHPTSLWDLGLHHAPQQVCGMRLLNQMESNLVRPDREVEALVIKAFSKNSDVWKLIARMTYWSMKGRNVDLYPLPENLPEKPEQMAKFALVRMIDDPHSVITVTSTNSLDDSIDQTWVVYSISPMQISIIERLNEKSILYIEETGLTHVGKNYLSYFTLKVYDDEETLKLRSRKVEPDYNYNTLKVQFYGKPLKDKIRAMEDAHHVDNYHILSVGITGTSSHDSVLSWLKIIQKKIPKLSKLNVVFRLERPTHEVSDADAAKGGQRHEKSNVG